MTVVPFLDRSDLVHYTTTTVEHNLAEGICWFVYPVSVPGESPGALIVALTIPFSLLFASICLDLRKIPPTYCLWARSTSGWLWTAPWSW